MRTDRYKIIQNEEAFAFTDALLGSGISYETAGGAEGMASGKDEKSSMKPERRRIKF